MTEPRIRPRRPRRADADRSVAAILEAALETLARDPDASLAEIARHAGLVRATVYVHFPTRDALLDAVSERALADVVRVVADAEPDRGDPVEALERVIGAGWQELGRYHPLVQATRHQPAERIHRRHLPVLELLVPLIERGQREGAFRACVPVSWHLSMLLALIHAASGEVQAGRADTEEARVRLVAAALGALSPFGGLRTRGNSVR